MAAPTIDMKSRVEATAVPKFGLGARFAKIASFHRERESESANSVRFARQQPVNSLDVREMVR